MWREIDMRTAVASLGGRLCFVVVLLFAYAHQEPARCPTPISRLDLLHALVAGRVNIDSYQTNTPDKAEYEGRFYSDKAPGTVALALPAFTASALALRLARSDLDSPSGWLISSWVACVGSIGIITALGAGFMFKWLWGWAGPRHALVTTLAIFLGAAPLPYATMMFSHAMVVGLIAIALWALDKPAAVEIAAPNSAQEPSNAQTGKFGLWCGTRRGELLAGLACGWALASEYTAGIVVVGMQ